jgi:hypothetical protein
MPFARLGKTTDTVAAMAGGKNLADDQENGPRSHQTRKRTHGEEAGMKASSPSRINRAEAAQKRWPTRWGGRSSGESLPRGRFGSSRGNGAESSKRSGNMCGSPIKRQGSGGGRSHDAKWARAAVSASTGRGGWRLGEGRRHVGPARQR